MRINTINGRGFPSWFPVEPPQNLPTGGGSPCAAATVRQITSKSTQMVHGRSVTASDPKRTVAAVGHAA
jgi:hypothetical protein